jgi:hypothetical protein
MQHIKGIILRVLTQQFFRFLFLIAFLVQSFDTYTQFQKVLNEITPSKLLENNIKVEEEFYVVLVH